MFLMNDSGANDDAAILYCLNAYDMMCSGIVKCCINYIVATVLSPVFCRSRRRIIDKEKQIFTVYSIFTCVRDGYPIEYPTAE